MVVEDSPVGASAVITVGMLPVLYNLGGLYSAVEGVCCIQHMRELRGTIIKAGIKLS